MQGIVSRRRAETEPPRTISGPNPWRERGAWSEAVRPSEFARDRKPEVSSRPEPTMLSFVPVICIMIDQEHVALYQNCIGLFYSCLMDLAELFPLENTISVSHDRNGDTISLKDDNGNNCRIVHREEIEIYTWRGVPVCVSTCRGGHSRKF